MPDPTPQLQADAWNRAHPVGTHVRVRRRPEEEGFCTYTRSEAHVVRGAAWVRVVGTDYACLLSHVEAIPAPEGEQL